MSDIDVEESDQLSVSTINWFDQIDQINFAFHKLAYDNNLETIEQIDEKILDNIILQKNLEGDNAYHISAKMGHMDLLYFLIEKDVDGLYHFNNSHFTPIYYLLENKDEVCKLIEDYDINDHYVSDITLTQYYILASDTEMFENLMENVKQIYLDEHLFVVIESDLQLETKLFFLENLLNSGSNIDAMNHKFHTPIIVAAIEKENKIIEFLIENDADISYSGAENTENLLLIAASQKNYSLMSKLLDAGINISNRDKYFRTPVHYIFENDLTIDIQRKILEKCTNINLPDKNLDTVLNLLMEYADWREFSDILEKKKLKIHINNKQGISPWKRVNESMHKQFLTMVYKSYINCLTIEKKWEDSIDNVIAVAIANGEKIKKYQSYILSKITGGQSYPRKKEKQKFNWIDPPRTNITHFSAYTYNYICFVYYILDTYNNVKIPSMPEEQLQNKTLGDFYKEMTEDFRSNEPIDIVFRSIIRDYINHSPLLINHLFIWATGEKNFISPYILHGIKDILTNHPETEYLLFKLTIINDKNFNHANILIFDISNKTVERFDPYGYVPYIDSDQIDEFLSSFFAKYFPNYQYISPLETSGGISYQVFSDENSVHNYIENDPNGFCVAWCIWYLEMRMLNIHADPKTLIRKTVAKINRSSEKFKDYIRNYSKTLDDQKNEILRSAGMPSQYWYSRHMPDDVYKKYIKYIRKIFYRVLM